MEIEIKKETIVFKCPNCKDILKEPRTIGCPECGKRFALPVNCKRCRNRVNPKALIREASYSVSPGYECLRCNFQWIPRKKDIIPGICPACKSKDWDLSEEQMKLPRKSRMALRLLRDKLTETAGNPGSSQEPTDTMGKPII